MNFQSNRPDEGDGARRGRVALLLARYPTLAPQEREELLAFYNTAPAIDTALLTCEETLRPVIALFLKREARHLRHVQKLGALKWTVGLSTAAVIYAIVMGALA